MDHESHAEHCIATPFSFHLVGVVGATLQALQLECGSCNVGISASDREVLTARQTKYGSRLQQLAFKVLAAISTKTAISFAEGSKTQGDKGKLWIEA